MSATATVPVNRVSAPSTNGPVVQAPPAAPVETPAQKAWAFLATARKSGKKRGGAKIPGLTPEGLPCTLEVQLTARVDPSDRVPFIAAARQGANLKERGVAQVKYTLDPKEGPEEGEHAAALADSFLPR